MFFYTTSLAEMCPLEKFFTETEINLVFLATLTELVNDGRYHLSLNRRKDTYIWSHIPRFASAGDDGLVLVWNVEVMHCEGIISAVCEIAPNTVSLIASISVQTGERLQELRGHSQQITAITTFTSNSGVTSHTSLITASSDRSLSVSLGPHSVL